MITWTAILRKGNTIFSIIFVNQNSKCPDVFNTETNISFHGKQPDKYDLLLGTIILLGSNRQEWKQLSWN